MKKLPKQLYATLTILLVSLLQYNTLLAQDGFGDGVTDVPIDGGLSLLVAAGVGYGIKKVRDGRKKAAEEKDSIMDK